MVAEGQRIVAGLQQSHEAELDRREAALQSAADAFAQYAQTQQIISSMNRPVNCITMDIQAGVLGHLVSVADPVTRPGRL
jgi:hypothetical protein